MKILRYRGETITLATTVGFSQTLGIPPGMNALRLEVPSATLENISLALTPKIRAVQFYDDSAAAYTDLTAALTDRNTTTGSDSSFNAMQAADYIYVGCPNRYRGLSIDVANNNSAGTATMAVNFWNGAAWATTTPTDGTFSTMTLTQDGLVTWTVPTTWETTTVNGSIPLYFVRINVSANLADTSVSMAQLVSLANLTLNAATSDAEGIDYMLLQSNNRTLPPYYIGFDVSLFGGIEMKSTSITSAANLTWLRV